MRGKKTVVNALAGLLEEIVAVICSFILPRLILSAFGSQYNGLTTSITQFLACAVLLRAGLGGATRAALYKPLAEKNKAQVDGIMKATDLFMKKVGLILGCGIVGFAIIYPFLVKNEFEWMFTFTLFLIIGASTFAESFFGITYLILLQADQRLWVSSVMRTVCYIFNTIVAAILITMGCQIHIVKLGSAVIYVLYPLMLRAYVRKKYKLDNNAKPITTAINQRWDALWQQVSTFVMENVDTIILTAFSTMLELSVYSVYNMVSNGIRRAVFAFSHGVEAALGNMIARNEKKALAINVSIVEIVLFSISTVVYTSAGILVLQFVGLYTKGIQDVNYIRPMFAYTLLLAQFFNCARIPYQMVVEAAGHFKQTKKVAIFEPIANIVISVLLVGKFGLTGVAIGTLVATVIRTVYYSVYASKHIVERNVWIAAGRCLTSAMEAAVIIGVVNLLHLRYAYGYLEWISNGIVVVVISCVVVLLGDVIFYRKDVERVIMKVKRIFRKKSV